MPTNHALKGGDVVSSRVQTTARRVKLTPPEVARRYGVSRDKVLAWIRSGELRAVNVATTLGRRPRYVIDEADLAAFEARRSAGTTAPAGGKRRKRIPEGVIEFF